MVPGTTVLTTTVTTIARPTTVATDHFGRTVPGHAFRLVLAVWGYVLAGPAHRLSASSGLRRVTDPSASPEKNRKSVSLWRLTVMSSSLAGDWRGVTAMEEIAEDKWLTRQELADRYGLPVKTPAEWASKGTGPRYAKIGRHVRYRLSDVIEWERKRFSENKRSSA